METKNVVSVAEMARMVGLSRSRFYQLVGTTFPVPLYDVATHRPFYDESMQQICIDVRRRNCGVDGKPVFFYCRGANAPLPKRKPKPAKSSQYVDLIDGLQALGLATTAERVAEAMHFLYPKGAGATSESEVLRSVFLHIKRQNTADNVQ